MNIVNDISKLNGVEFLSTKNGSVVQMIIWQPYPNTKHQMSLGKPVSLSYDAGTLKTVGKSFVTTITVTLQMCKDKYNTDIQNGVSVSTVDPNSFTTLYDYVVALSSNNLIITI